MTATSPCNSSFLGQWPSFRGEGHQAWLTKSEVSTERLGSTITHAIACVRARVMQQGKGPDVISSSSSPSIARLGI